MIDGRFYQDWLMINRTFWLIWSIISRSSSMIDRDQSLTDFTKSFEEIIILPLNVENLTILNEDLYNLQIFLYIKKILTIISFIENS